MIYFKNLKFHYLVYEQPVGEHLKYLVWAQGRPVGVLASSVAQRLVEGLPGADLRIYPGNVESFRDLKARRIEAVVLPPGTMPMVRSDAPKPEPLDADGLEKAKATLELASALQEFAGADAPKLANSLRSLDGPLKAAVQNLTQKISAAVAGKRNAAGPASAAEADDPAHQ